MADREKVIKGLECCSQLDDGNICPVECPYAQDVCYGTVQLMADALELLKAQEPRVLTRKEVQNDCPDYVYLETSTGRLECCIKDEGESDKRVGDFVYELDEFFIKAWKDYGKTWRCWSNRPTEEQRKAVKWE